MEFKIEGNKFIKDGQEIKIISGAVHYFRNMKDTWRDIFKKMKAMGLNCVETYCAWNMHEKQKGVFDFSGMLDIKRFLTVAQEEGLMATYTTGEIAAHVYYLAICKYESSGTHYLFQCNSNYEVEGDSAWDSVEECMHKAGAKLKNREGYANGGWILLDYYDIIIHIFVEEERSFYDLEHVWRDGNLISIGDL